MIQLARLQPQPLVLDIGAGSGSLTIPLAKEGWRVLAVENDPEMAAKLRVRVVEHANVRVIEQDIRELRLPGRPFSVVANIPFSITTPILGMLMDRPTGSFQQAVLIVEHGAARRFTGTPITDLRILSWRIWFEMRLVRAVSPAQFFPRPRVQAAILSICRKPHPPVAVSEHAHFMGLAAHALRAPHWPMYAALHGLFTAVQIKHVVRTLGVDREDPVCSLTESQWALLYATMRRHVPAYRWPSVPRHAWLRAKP